MKTIKILFAVFLITCYGCKKDDIKTIQVEINKNTETIFILYPIVDIGIPPIKGSLYKIARQYFQEFKAHKVVKLLDTLINRTGIDGPVNLVLHFSELPKSEQLHQIDTNILRSLSPNGSIEEGQNLVTEFMESLSDFYVEASIQTFFDKYQDYYNKANKDVEINLPPPGFIETMERYYGKQNKAYILNPSPTLYPGFGFGTRINTKNGLIVCNTFGPLNDLHDDSLELRFDFDNYQEIRDLTVHEFGHSFVNPITELPGNRELIDNYSYLFMPIKNYMAKQAYRSWWTCVTEHIVRLGEIRIALAMNDSTTANKIRHENIETNKFIYLPYLENKIFEYEKNREKYKTFADYFPKLIEAFAEIDTTKLEI